MENSKKLCAGVYRMLCSLLGTKDTLVGDIAIKVQRPEVLEYNSI